MCVQYDSKKIETFISNYSFSKWTQRGLRYYIPHNTVLILKVPGVSIVGPTPP